MADGFRLSYIIVDDITTTQKNVKIKIQGKDVDQIITLAKLKLIVHYHDGATGQWKQEKQDAEKEYNISMSETVPRKGEAINFTREGDKFKI